MHQRISEKEKQMVRDARDVLIVGIAIILFLVFVFPLPKELDFYEYHIWECEQAHAANKTFALFTGKKYEPAESHFQNQWLIHPLEDPTEVVPHGCISLEKKYRTVFGIFGRWITDTTITAENIGDLEDRVEETQ